MPHSVFLSNAPLTLDDIWLADLVDQSSREIYVFDEPTCTLLRASAAACCALNCGVDELRKMQLPDVLPEVSAECLERTIAGLRDCAVKEATLSAKRRSANSSETPIELRLSLLQLPDRSVLIAVVDNAKTGMRFDTRAIRSEERLAQIEAHVPGLLFQLRRQPSGALQFDFLSQACEDLLGMPANTLYAASARFFGQIVEKDRQELTEKMQQSSTSFVMLNWEGRIWIESWQDFKWINVRATPSDEGERGLLWTGLMANITQSKRLAEEIRKSREQLAELSAHIDNAREKERERIERDLHDDLGGNLSALKMMLGQVWKQAPQTPFFLERRDYLNQLIDRSIESIHRISVDLRPGILDAGLVAAIEWLAQEQQRQNGIPYHLHSDWQDIALPPPLATSLFRIAQEACNNIRKHAHATHVDIYLHEDNGELVLEVTDNGIGIADERRHNPRSFGLLGMSERMSALGGRFQLTTRCGQGTTVRVTTPLHTP